jgi:hypothetical protein
MGCPDLPAKTGPHFFERLPQLGVSRAPNQSLQSLLERPFVGCHHARINESSLTKLQPFRKADRTDM